MPASARRLEADIGRFERVRDCRHARSHAKIENKPILNEHGTGRMEEEKTFSILEKLSPVRVSK